MIRRLLFLSITAGISLCFLSCHTHERQSKFLITEPIVFSPKEASSIETLPEERDYNEIFARANEHFDAGDINTAERYYHEILAHNPTYPHTPFCYYNLGLIALKRRDYEQAQSHFKAAYLMLTAVTDKADALYLRIHSLARLARWQEIVDVTDMGLSNDFSLLSSTHQSFREILLQYAEAKAMLGFLEDARRIVQHIVFEIRREHPPQETFFIPELAMAYFVMGRTFVSEFRATPFEGTFEKLVTKCTLIQEAQRWFLETIRVGIIYWTNAAAYELATLYRNFFDEMNNYPIPPELNDEERFVYVCELWEKTAGLLRKARRTLKRSIESAKQINEYNEFIEESLRLLVEINAAYAAKETNCRTQRVVP